MGTKVLVGSDGRAGAEDHCPDGGFVEISGTLGQLVMDPSADTLLIARAFQLVDNHHHLVGGYKNV